MEENRDDWLERPEKLGERMKDLPVEMKNAICWAMKNLDALEKAGRQSKMTAKELQKGMVYALVEKDYKKLIRLYITKYMKESKENEEI